MNKVELLKNLPDLLIDKKVIWFLGSGTSSPGMPLLGNFKMPSGGYDIKRLLEEIADRNRRLLNAKYIEERRPLTRLNDEIIRTKDAYIGFLEAVLSTLNATNAREIHKSTDIFTTNYDLFIEYAADSLLHSSYRFVFNDGAQGYFSSILDSSNFDTTTAYKGRFDNYINEIPSLNLIKPHGSVNWKIADESEKIIICKNVCEPPELVSPNGHEPDNTVLRRHFYEMFRYFEYETTKPETIIIVHGFSFGDEHILEMFNRALENNRLLLIIFAYTDAASQEIQEKFETSYRNLYVLSPSDFSTGTSSAGKYIDLSQLTNIVLHGKML